MCLLKLMTEASPDAVSPWRAVKFVASADAVVQLEAQKHKWRLCGSPLLGELLNSRPVPEVLPEAVHRDLRLVHPALRPPAEQRGACCRRHVGAEEQAQLGEHADAAEGPGGPS